ncbi:MAG: AAA family ATPase [Lachnospiraceae bacterium]|nr:AAA family ATPase [Lachnospiraceae bacterium]
MKVSIKHCNNIDSGEFDIVENRLNIKYAINGTGKSTISKAIDAFVNNDEDKKKSLLPFTYYKEDNEIVPELNGCEQIKKIAVFNEKYIEDYVYQQNELLKNSFEIFVKTADYDKHIKEIEKLLNSINVTFQNHPELETLIKVFQQFIEGFGKAKSGYSAAGAIGKGIGKGNKIDNIPEGLEVYEPYLKNSENVKWIKWQLEGKHFLDMADQCPYCSGSVRETKNTILKVSDEYDAKAVEQLNKMLEVFATLSPYFSDTTAAKIEEITKNVTGITSVQKNYLLEIKSQVESLLQQLYGLKRMGFHSLKNAEKIADELVKYKIDLAYYSHLNSILSQEKVAIINGTLDEVLAKAGKLQGEIAQQKKLIKTTIEMYSTEINEFLRYAGYKYQVAIEEEKETTEYHLVLKHIDGTENVQTVDEHLSYGERNAFALVLFMYNALKDEPDLVILDDPISSFDGNKKFAIINMLFMGKHSLKNRTVLLLTHEFNTVIDAIYNMPYNFNPSPKAAFLTTKEGILTEKEITKSDIKSFGEIAQVNIDSNMDSLNKLVYLRRLLEIQNADGLAWQLLSNIFHKREKPEIHFLDGSPSRLMTQEEIEKATVEIKDEYIADFAYDQEYQKTQNVSMLRTLYQNSGSNYEKLQIYRIMFNENSSNSVIKKFVNEAFHIENDYLFQLNPCEYDTVPQYIIDECDKEVFADAKEERTA